MKSSDDSAGAELRIICGPTAAGKSGIALALAAGRGLVIVSADSRQVYREFDIGTAKPSAQERAAVAHRGVDVADPAERWSAARWARDAEQWVDEAGGRALVVGGTGFYLRALVSPLFESPLLDPVRRAALAVFRTQPWISGSNRGFRKVRLNPTPLSHASSPMPASTPSPWLSGAFTPARAHGAVRRAG